MLDTQGARLTPAGVRGGDEVVCSVIIPTYNRAEWLPGCIASVRDSGVRHHEIIVVDDGSTDGTREVVEQLGDDIRYLYQDNAGEAAARNTGLSQARGRYVAFLDSDDRWLRGGHQQLIDFLEAQPEVAVGFADGKVGNSRDGYRGWIELTARKTFWEVPCREFPGGYRQFERGPFFRRLVARGLPIFIDTVIVRRRVLQQAGGFDEALRRAEDWELWLRLALRHTFAYYDRPIAVYERHADSLTADLEAMEVAFVQVQRLILDKELSLTIADRAWVKARLAEQMYDRAYDAFDRGDLAATRERCGALLAACGLHPRALFYWGCSWFRTGDVRRLRALKARLEDACARGPSAGRNPSGKS